MSNWEFECESLKAENAKLRAALNYSWRMAIKYPFPQVCKHLIACNILSSMEEIGFEVPRALAKAVVECNDAYALSFGSLEPRSKEQK
jgi:hypothetical protein